MAIRVPILDIMAAVVPHPVKTVLVADDTAFVRDRFRTALEAAGHRTVEAKSGAEVLTILQEDASRIDLVLLDLQLSGGRGLDLARRIRSIAPDRPIVVFSGTIAQAREVVELTSLGISGYINEYIGAQNLVLALAPYLFPEAHNRRASPRVALNAQVTYRTGTTIATAVSLNVSTGGAAVRTTSPLEVGTTMEMRFRVPRMAHDIKATARVAWATTRFGMGLQFVTIDPSDRSAIEAHVNAHFFTNRKA